MPQIAQQDYLYIRLSDYGLGDYALDELVDYVNTALWEALQRYARNKSLLDAVIVDSDEIQFARVCSISFEDNGDLYKVEYIFEGHVFALRNPNE